MMVRLTEKETDTLKQIIEMWLSEGFVCELNKEQKSIINKLGIER